MKHKLPVAILILFTGLSGLYGQERSADAGKTLERLFKGISSDISDREKVAGNDSIISILDGYSRSDSVFVHKFNNLRFLGQIESKDSKLKIIAWNLLLKDTASRYYCYFINRKKDSNKVCRLTSNYNKEPADKDKIYTADDWYGALYYDLRPVKKDNQIYWILLGIDYGNPAITRKIADVVRFTADDKIEFGKPLFKNGSGIHCREILEYSFTAVVSLRFLTDKVIVFDHLVPFSAEYRNNHEFYGPDFSYDAYRYEKGLWQFKTNFDVRNPEK